MNFHSMTIKSPLFINKGDKIKCLACRHGCIIDKGKTGFCGVRVNDGGVGVVPYGYVSSLNIDPIEKKPLYHFLPGHFTLSFGMLGCNFRCLYCQNYEISQILNLKEKIIYIKEISPPDFLNILSSNNLDIIVSTYNEPTITVEWAKDIFELAKKKNPKIKTGFVSNGYITKQAFDYIKNFLDFIKIDFKSFNKEKFNHLCGANLDFLIDSIEMICKNKIHVEFVTLIVEGFNDSIDEIEKMADFIKKLSPDIPWHLTKFHPDYKMNEIKETNPVLIEKLIEKAKEKGLNYVYGGNYNTKNSSTFCPKCKAILIKRGYMSLIENNLFIKDGKGFCPECGFEIYGVWEK
ncbi:MAG: AmmeMemoRadiSam system radical SAM enzyme [Elusimicrobiota bacterium]